MINARKVSSFFAIIMRGGGRSQIFFSGIFPKMIFIIKQEFMSEIIGVTTQHFTPHKLQYLKRMRARFFRIKNGIDYKTVLSLKYLVSQHSTPLHTTLNSEN